ncbi:MAG TPA: NADH:flavin oxidoreductase [Kofleriaceae bacterium]|nr:NADH:flavin oxidoreductase [Kofleriaceae bacterium]
MLYEPLVFRNGVRARNRTWLAPMTNQMSHADGSLSDDELRWLEMRARGGFGVIETCAAHVSLDGQAWPGELGVYDDRLLPGMRRLACALGAAGALGIVQLFHGGVRASSQLTGEQTWSASAIEGARDATANDIARVISRFRDAAVRCHAAGFHGIELHGAHGFLFTQFLSTTMNRRGDQWGGTLEGRARLLRDTMRAVRAAVPPSFVVGVRLSPEDHGNAKGIDLDESVEVARWLCDDGADFIHLSLWDWRDNTRKRSDLHAVSLFRSALARDVAIVAAGGVWTREDAEALLDKGASAVAIGRAAIANPEWAANAAIAGWAPRRPPLTKAELLERGLSPGFVEYMRNWKSFVAQPSREATTSPQALR